MVHAFGKARIQHADTGVVYEIDGASLDFYEGRYRPQKGDLEVPYYAVVDHPQLGRLTWSFFEHPEGIRYGRKTNVGSHELLDDVGFGIGDNPSQYNDDDQNKIESLVEEFYKTYEEAQPVPSYLLERGGDNSWIDDINSDVRDAVANIIYDESDEIAEAVVKAIESTGIIEWSEITHPDPEDYAYEEPIIDDNLKDIDDKLNTLIDNAPAPTTDPAFAFGEDNLLHIIDPPDNQPVDSQDELLDELRTVIDDLSGFFAGHNRYLNFVPIIEKFKEAISGEQISITRLYARGTRLENMAKAINRDIESGEPSLSSNTDECLKTAITLHEAYIMLNPEGQRLMEASAAYHRTPEQTQELKTAGEQFANSIVEKPDLFGEDVCELFSDFSSDIGNGQHPERSNYISGNTVSNFVLGVLKNIKSLGVMAISGVVGGVVATTDIGIATITTSAEYINIFCSFLTNSIPSLQVIATFFAEQLPWLAEAVQFLGRIIPMIPIF